VDRAATHDAFMACMQVRLTEQTVNLADGAAAVCVFVNDEVTEKVLTRLSELNVRSVALRCAGYGSHCAAVHRSVIRDLCPYY
jgi:D-lactate dehydrogenase